MQTSEVMVAINEDPYDPVSEVITWSIVGDLLQTVPMLIAKLRQARDWVTGVGFLALPFG